MAEPRKELQTSKGLMVLSPIHASNCWLSLQQSSTIHTVTVWLSLQQSSTIHERHKNLGGSPDRASAGFAPKKSTVSSSGQSWGSSSSSHNDFLQKFVDSEILTANLEEWFYGIYKEAGFRKPAFDIPFELTELQNFDYALEGVLFQQLIRMPNAINSSTFDAVKERAYLAIKDFLHAGVKGLWETFWGQDGPMPFTIACKHGSSSKFYPAEKGYCKWNA